MITVSHPTGNQFVRNALQALEDANLLGRFTTSIATFSGNAWDRIALSGIGAEFARRSYDNRLRRKTFQSPWRELGRFAAPRLGLSLLNAHETGPFCVDAIYRAQDRRVAKSLRRGTSKADIKAAYCFEDGALETFRAAKKQEIRCLYDLPIGYWRVARRIQADEAERLPEWAATMSALLDSDDKVARKDEELKLADAIFVASSFTARTLDEVPFELPKPIVIPYGAPAVSGQLAVGSWPIEDSSKPLRVLFVGGLSQRKGLSYLFQAVENLGAAVDLTVIGGKPKVVCRALDAALAHCRYIPSLPHEQILGEMARHDVLVFPSLFEGFGLVVTEALSQGIPVITTAHTCGPDVIDEGVDGFVVPIRNSEAIAEKLELLNRDRARLHAMKEAARTKAAELTWAKYRQALVEAVKPFVA